VMSSFICSGLGISNGGDAKERLIPLVPLFCSLQ
jgi:hypothetical protein